MIKELDGKKPIIDEDSFIAETAVLIGNVEVNKGASIWYNAVLRGDNNLIKIEENANVQDNATIHVDKNYKCIVGKNSTIGHNALVHGCIIGDNCLIGMGAIVLNGAVIGENSIIGAGAVVTEGAVIPANSLVVGVPGKIKKELSEEDIENIRKNGEDYVQLWREKYK